MNKNISIVAGVALLLALGFFWLNHHIYTEKQGPTDHKNATFVIDNTPITLMNGVSEVEQAGSASKIVTKYFGNEAKGDLNNDGIPDAAFLLTQETGGSGTFFYVVAAIQTPNKTYNGTHAAFIGDRIAPQSTGIHNGLVVVNYADRAPGEPMTAQPSVGKSIWFKLDPETMQFGEVEQDFEGEADPSRMTLNMKTWNWISALYNDGREVRPKKAGVFTLTFQEKGRFTATTDCNSVGGQYVAEGKSITFSALFMTKRYCEGSEEGEFMRLLQETSGYHFTSRGELILDLKFDSGSVILR